MVTVDDSIHLLTYDEVDSLVQRLEPRVVVPMHYFIPGLSASGNELLPPERWLDRQQTVRRLDSCQADFSPGSLPGQHRGLAVPAGPGVAVRAGNCPLTLSRSFDS